MNNQENNLFFTCSLIELIARLTNNKKKDIIKMLTKENISKIYNHADVYHCENINQVAEEFINNCHIEKSNYQLELKNNQPTYFDIGKVYTRLIVMLSKNESDYIEKLVEVMSSWIIEKIDNYKSSLYYETPSYIYECYQEGKII